MSAKTPAALVTGANSGIGHAICRRLIAEGYHVFAHIRTIDRGAQLASDFDGTGSFQLVEADLSSEGAVQHILDQVAVAPQELQLIVNNAGGVMGETRFEPGVVQDFAAIYHTNVAVAYELSVLGAAIMGTGSIVNIASINGTSAMVGSRIPLYSSSKAALIHLSRLLAVKLAPGVRVNVVSPGRTRNSAWGEPEEDRERAIVSDALIQRWITADEIADAVWFLTENRGCTGVELPVDGGIGLKATLTNT